MTEGESVVASSAHVRLSESNICRLCAQPDEKGIPIFVDQEEEERLSKIINRYLPIHVVNDGRYPTNICRWCETSLQGVCAFLELLILGQKLLLELRRNERSHTAQQKCSNFTSNTFPSDEVEEFVNSSYNSSIYPKDHEVRLSIVGSNRRICKQRSIEITKKVMSSVVPKLGRFGRQLRKPQRYSDDVYETGKALDEGEDHHCAGKTKTDPSGVAESSLFSSQSAEPGVSFHGNFTLGSNASTVLDKEPLLDVGVNLPSQPSKQDNTQLFSKTEAAEMEPQSPVLAMFQSEVCQQPHTVAYVLSDAGCEQSSSISPASLSDTHDRQHAQLPDLLSTSDVGENVTHEQGALSREVKKILGLNVSEGDTETTGLPLDSFSGNCTLTFDFDPNYVGTFLPNTSFSTLPDTLKSLVSNELQKSPNDSCHDGTFGEDSSSKHQMSRGIPDMTMRMPSVEALKKDSLDGCNSSEFQKIDCAIEDHLDESDASENLSSTSKLNLIGCEGRSEGISQISMQCPSDQGKENKDKILKSSSSRKKKKAQAFQCKNCNLQFDSYASLIAHRKELHPSKSICIHCDPVKEFKSRAALSYHVKACHKLESHECQTCHKTFRHRRILLQHLTTHNPKSQFLCTLCNRTFRSRGSLANHLLTHRDIRKYECNHCGQRFAQKTTLDNHIRTHTGERKFQCDFCQKSFIQRSNLIEHRRIHTGEKPYICAVCLKSFASLYRAKAHVQIHSSASFQCGKCGKNFTSPASLRKHYNRHNWPKSHVCEVCGKSFMQKLPLLHHQLTHTGEKPYTCETCGKQFGNPSNLRKHQKSIHHAATKMQVSDVENTEKAILQMLHSEGEIGLSKDGDSLLVVVRNIQGDSHVPDVELSQNISEHDEGVELSELRPVEDPSHLSHLNVETLDNSSLKDMDLIASLTQTEFLNFPPSDSFSPVEQTAANIAFGLSNDAFKLKDL